MRSVETPVKNRLRKSTVTGLDLQARGDRVFRSASKQGMPWGEDAWRWNANDERALFKRVVTTDAPAAVILMRVMVGGVFFSEGVQKFLLVLGGGRLGLLLYGRF